MSYHLAILLSEVQHDLVSNSESVLTAVILSADLRKRTHFLPFLPSRGKLQSWAQGRKHGKTSLRPLSFLCISSFAQQSEKSSVPNTVMKSALPRLTFQNTLVRQNNSEC